MYFLPWLFFRLACNCYFLQFWPPHRMSIKPPGPVGHNEFLAICMSKELVLFSSGQVFPPPRLLPFYDVSFVNLLRQNIPTLGILFMNANFDDRSGEGISNSLPHPNPSLQPLLGPCPPFPLQPPSLGAGTLSSGFPAEKGPILMRFFRAPTDTLLPNLLSLASHGGLR